MTRWHFTSVAVWSVAVLVACAVPAADDGARDDGFVWLFDGTNLDAWQTSPQAHWTVEEGVISLKDRTDGALNNDDYLWSQESYGNFVLELEYKTPEGQANSGVFLRTADLRDPVYSGIEIQISHSYGRKEVSRGGTAGAVYDCLAPRKNLAKPPGQWNRCRITCRDNWIQVELNEEVVTEMDLDLWTETGKNPDGTPNKFTKPLKQFARCGHIGLQDHGRPIWYRNVRVKRLP
jgi:hypothetical protein